MQRVAGRMAARIAGKERTGNPVHRRAVDWQHPDATRPRLIGDGTRSDEEDVHKAMNDVVERMQADSVADGVARHQGIFGNKGVRVFQVLSIDMQFNGDGRSDLAYSTIAEEVGCSSPFRRYHALIDAGVIDYQPRSIEVPGPKAFGRPPRVQATSIAFLTPERLTPKYRALLYERLEFWRAERRRENEARYAALRARYVRERLGEVAAQKMDDARDGGTPPRRRRTARPLDPARANPTGLARLEQNRTAAAEQRQAEEAATAAYVRANAAALMKQAGLAPI